MAWGAMFQSPACMSLAIRRAPRLGASALEVVDLADVELVGGHLAAGGVVDDVLADSNALMTAGLVGLRSTGSSSRRGPAASR